LVFGRTITLSPLPAKANGVSCFFGGESRLPTYCRTASTFVAATDFVFSGMLCEQGIILFLVHLDQA
jgi:hypothetical protein